MWKAIARFIITRKAYIILALLAMIVFGAFHAKVELTKSEAKLLPEHDSVWINFKAFRNTFGQEDNMIVIGFEDSKFFTKKNFRFWKNLTDSISKQKGVQQVIAINDIKILTKNDSLKQFELKPLYPDFKPTDEKIKQLQTDVDQYPFYKGILKSDHTYQAAIYLDPTIVDTPLRIEAVNYIENQVHQYEEKTGVNLHLSGIPVIRTNNAKELSKEATLYILGSLFITSFIFFLFFRSFRATFISLLVVLIAVLMAFASLNTLGYELTALTALVPPLLIVIGIPNCIFLINKYQQEFKKHRNKIKALQRMIMKVGNATLMTNFTTAFGFLTFIFTDSDTLREFGLVASINIIWVFVLSILIIPIGFSFMPEPKPRHLKHLEKKWMNHLVDHMEYLIINKRKSVYAIAFIILGLSIVGILKIRTSGNMLDDLAKGKEFYQDISFFDKDFGGILPLEIMIDGKKPKSMMKLSTLKKIEELSQFIDSLNTSSSPIAIDRLVKFGKQAYYNGNKEYYSLPDDKEKNFILNYAKKSISNTNVLKNYIDSTGQKTRITTFVKNVETEDLEHIFEQITKKKDELFPKNQYNTYLTGASFVFLNGTYYLSKNLLLSIVLAIALIAVFMAIMFASPKMVFVSLVPNLLPIITTAGIMGYLGIPLKPSTILVFSIAFGIAVDDTIHFLAKYRQELKVSKGDIYHSVLNALRETGVSMFYTSVVLFCGFGIFMFSNFGGTVALGGLVSLTLLVAIMSDLILLPAMLLSFNKLTNKDFIEPDIDIFKTDDDETIVVDEDELIG
ncbi:MAG: efflux RND transporter permease subunit [Flavobacteriales bacterium]